MEAQSEALGVKLDINVDLVVNGRPVHIEAKVAGEGDAAERAADELSRAIAQVIVSAASEAAPALQAVSSQDLPLAPAAQPIAATRAAKPPSPPSPAMMWVQRNRARINIGFGIVLVVLALMVPLIVPPAQRSDVLVLTILFTLAGALLLFTAFLPSRSKAASQAAIEPAQSKSSAAPAASSAALSARREQLLKPATKRSGLKTGWGITLSLVFIIAGLLAPFLLGAANADERFLIMLGFVPISVVGFFMLAVFGRQYFNKLVPAVNHSAPAAKINAPAAKRAPVSRVPQNVEYRAVIPIAIVSALILMIVVVALVIYATFASVAR